MRDEEAVRKQLLARIIQHRSDQVVSIAAAAFSDLLCDAHDELAHDLLEPIFKCSDFWPEQLAKQILGLDDDYECSCSELLVEFEQRELLGSREIEGPVNAWVREGF